MKEIYKGYEIEAHRESSLAGYEMLYYSVFRKMDNLECVSGCMDSEDEPELMIYYLKGRVDAEEASDDPWGEGEALADASSL